MKPRWWARPRERRDPGGMNQTEKAFAEYLQMLKLAGRVASWEFEPPAFELAHHCTYTTDFRVWYIDSGQTDMIEVKGYWEEDARVKWKVAAELNKQYRFLAVKAIRWSRELRAPEAWEVEIYGQGRKERWTNIRLG